MSGVPRAFVRGGEGDDSPRRIEPRPPVALDQLQLGVGEGALAVSVVRAVTVRRPGVAERGMALRVDDVAAALAAMHRSGGRVRRCRRVPWLSSDAAAVCGRRPGRRARLVLEVKDEQQVGGFCGACNTCAAGAAKSSLALAKGAPRRGAWLRINRPIESAAAAALIRILSTD